MTRPAPPPYDEAAALKASAGFNKVERFMRKHGLSEAEIANVLVGRAMLKLWIPEEERHELRTRITAMVDARVDHFFDALGR